MNVSAKSVALVAAVFLSLSFAETESFAASQTWGANASSAWFTVGNWAGGAYPGVTNTITANNDVATFTSAATGTTFGINMGQAGGILDLGSISLDSTRSTTSIGDSSATAGSLRLYGATVNSVPDVILRNNGTGLLTVQAAQSGTMGLVLSDATDNKIYIDNTGGITISSIISGGSANKLSLAGSGSGVLTLSGANTYSGNTTITSGTLAIGSDTATLGDGTGTLILGGGTFFRGSQTTAQSFNNPISMTASSVIAGNPTSGSRIIPFSSSSVSGSAGTLTISNSATSGTGSLQVRFFGSFTFTQPVSVGKAFASSFIYLQFYNNAATGDQTWSGLISGNGTLYKNTGSGPGGNVILSSGNIYTGGTEIRGGFFGLGTDNALGYGTVLVGFDSNPLGLFASGAARSLTNDVAADMNIVNSTNLQIKGSQNLTLAGRILIHTNTMFFTISNSALTTFSGVVTNAGITSKGICKTGPGTLVLSGANTFSGTTTVGAGTLALTGSGSINNSTNLAVVGGATLDLSGLSSPLALNSSQTLTGLSTNGATGTIILSGTASLTLGSTSPLVLAYTNGTPVLTVTGGVFTVASGNLAAVTVANGGVGLAAGDYKLISTNTGGFVAGTAPASVTVVGDGIAGSSSSLVISNSELYLRVAPSSSPPGVPVANAAAATNITSFTASWNSASGAAGYRLDVSTVNNFSSYVTGYSNLDVGAVGSFVVAGLSQNTIYYYQVRATNAFGTSSSSATIAVTTLVAPNVWNAGGGNWSAAGSWQYANVPGNGAAPGFIGAGGNSANDLTGLLLNSLTFSNGAGAYVISGNPLVISNGIVNGSTASETISAPLTLGAAETFAATAGPLTIAGAVTNAGNTLTLNTTLNLTNSGPISGAGGLVKIGAGTLALAGTNTYAGGTTINAGTVQISGGAALNTSAVTLANVASATLGLSDNETVGALAGGGPTGATVALGVNNLSVSSGPTAYGGAVTGTGKLIKTGTGTLTLSNSAAIGSSFTLRVEGGTAELSRNGAALTGILGSGNRIELAGGNLQLSASAQANFAMSIAGLDIYSDSTLTFNRTGGNSSQSPTVTLPLNFKAGSKLAFAYAASILGGTSTFDGAANTLQGDGTFVLGNYNVTIANPIGESGGSFGFTKAGVGQLNLSAVNTYSGNTTNAQGTIALNATSTFGNGAGALVLAGGNILDSNTRASAPIANPILMTADTTIYGDSILANSLRIFPLSGPITTVAGTLIIRNEDTNSTVLNNEFRVRLSAGGLNLTQPIAIGSASDLPITNAIAELEFYSTNTDAAQTVSGNISGPGSLYRSLATGGTTILTGSNTYSGGTLVTGGTLLINNATGSGTGTNTVIVSSGGTLGGTGTIGGVTTLQAGAILAAGNAGSGTLTFTNALALNALSTNAFAVTSAGGASNKVVVVGTLTPNGSVIKVTTGTALQSGTYPLFTYGNISGSFNPAATFDVAPIHPAVIVDDGAGHINLVVSNQPPVANTMTVTRTAGFSVKIALSDLSTNWSDADGDPVALSGISLVTTNFVNLTTNSTFIFYPNSANVSDQFSYSISDGQGGTNLGLVNIITVSSTNVAGQATGLVNTSGGTVTLSFAGIPSYGYSVQRSTNLLDWATIWTTNAPSGGLFNYTDSFIDLGGTPPASAYYRLGWNP